MVNDLLGRVSLDYAKFMEGHLQALFPADCEDHKQFIADHQIHLRSRPSGCESELWMDSERVGTFSKRFENNTIIFEFTK